MPTIDLGNIKFNWKGPWSGSSVSYALDDVVEASGAAYICKTAHSSSGSSFSSGTNWDLMVRAGTNWASGTSVPTSTANEGDFYFKTNDETIYKYTSGSWNSLVDIGGSVWTSDNSTPAGSSGEINDFHLNTSNLKVYQKTASSTWTEKVNLGNPTVYFYGFFIDSNGTLKVNKTGSTESATKAIAAYKDWFMELNYTYSINNNGNLIIKAGV